MPIHSGCEREPLINDPWSLEVVSGLLVVHQGSLGAEWPESLVKRLQGVAEHMKRVPTAMQTRI